MITVTRRLIMNPKLSDAAMHGIKEILLNFMAGHPSNDAAMRIALRDTEAKIYSLLLRDGQSNLFPVLVFDEEVMNGELELTFDEGIVEETE